MTTVALIGHPAYLLEPVGRRWVHRELLRAAVRLRDAHGMSCGISGMTRGPGMWWADAVHRARVDLRLHLPHPRQADGWPDADRAEWMRLMGYACRAPVVYGASAHPRTVVACHHAMIDEADELLVVWQPGMRGQVSDAVRYALTRGQRPTWIDPAQQWIHRPPVEEWRRILPEPVATAETGPARGTRNRRDDQAGSARVANTRPYPPAPKGPAESRRS